MAFRIEVAAKAETDISEGVDYIRKDSPTRAIRWYEDLFLALQTLDALPGRYPLIPESGQLKRNLRSIHHHSHRVIYEVDEEHEIVFVIRVFHSARKPLSKKEI